MARDAQRQARRRAVDRHGETLTVRTYEFGGTTDEYGDDGRTETDGSPHSATGRVDVSSSASVDRNSAGTSISYDATVYLPDDVDFSNALNGVESDKPPSEIERSGGTVYRVERVETSDDGLIACRCEVKA